MTTTKQRTIQKSLPGRKRRVVEENDLTWELSYLQDENEELKNDNRLLRKLVVELSLGKLKAEQYI